MKQQVSHIGVGNAFFLVSIYEEKMVGFHVMPLTGMWDLQITDSDSSGRWLSQEDYDLSYAFPAAVVSLF